MSETVPEQPLSVEKVEEEDANANCVEKMEDIVKNEEQEDVAEIKEEGGAKSAVFNTNFTIPKKSAVKTDIVENEEKEKEVAAVTAEPEPVKPKTALELERERLELPYPQCDTTKIKVAEIPNEILECFLEYKDNEKVRLNLTQLNLLITTQLNKRNSSEVYANDWRNQEIPKMQSVNFVVPKNHEKFPHIVIKDFNPETMAAEESRLELEDEKRRRTLELRKLELDGIAPSAVTSIQPAERVKPPQKFQQQQHQQKGQKPFNQGQRGKNDTFNKPQHQKNQNNGGGQNSKAKASNSNPPSPAFAPAKVQPESAKKPKGPLSNNAPSQKRIADPASSEPRKRPADHFGNPEHVNKKFAGPAKKRDGPKNQNQSNSSGFPKKSQQQRPQQQFQKDRKGGQNNKKQHQQQRTPAWSQKRPDPFVQSPNAPLSRSAFSDYSSQGFSSNPFNGPAPFQQPLGNFPQSDAIFGRSSSGWSSELNNGWSTGDNLMNDDLLRMQEKAREQMVALQRQQQQLLSDSPNKLDFNAGRSLNMSALAGYGNGNPFGSTGSFGGSSSFGTGRNSDSFGTPSVFSAGRANVPSVSDRSLERNWGYGYQ
ncbi:unnamed protein product [Caenorhabditis auriculariae]|uniref:Uncharacterized protein n=1 Tax=Caenorhabditis auriculariae TaxID=2777116 RepID=A0A8S1HGM3_9PELO|nr:unnamed protein product [Caenorhabditis auriculariae]